MNHHAVRLVRCHAGIGRACTETVPRVMAFVRSRSQLPPSNLKSTYQMPEFALTYLISAPVIPLWYTFPTVSTQCSIAPRNSAIAEADLVDRMTILVGISL